MPSPNAADLQIGAVFHGRYRVVRAINSGAMGSVYEVVDDNTNAPRALKVMLPSVLADADQRARFTLEAKVTGNIESDHLIRVFDAGIDEASQTPFLVMDLLRGEELGQMLTKRKALPPGEAVLYLTQAARALDKTHAAGIVHRDLKPANLFVTYRDDGSPCVKILDFGIAKVLAGGGNQAEATKALGTPLYMSPEQIRGAAQIGPRCDLYALGHMAYALLTGEAYWKEESQHGDSLLYMVTKIIEGAREPARARALRRNGVTLPEGFDTWFFKATAPGPEHRFERATEAIGALAAALGLDGAARSMAAPGQAAGQSNSAAAPPAHPMQQAAQAASSTGAVAFPADRSASSLGLAAASYPPQAAWPPQPQPQQPQGAQATWQLAPPQPQPPQGQWPSTPPPAPQANPGQWPAGAPQSAQAAQAAPGAWQPGQPQPPFLAAPAAPIKKSGFPLILLIAAPALLVIVGAVGIIAYTMTSGSGETAVYADSFESDKGKWMQPAGAGDRVYVESGKLQLVANAADTVLTLPTAAAVRNLDAFTVEVEVTRLSGPDTGYAGVVFRWSDANESYSAGYNGAGFYGLVRYSAATQKFTPLLDYKKSAAVNPAAGATNLLKIVVRGADITFFINGEQLGKVSDRAIPAGRIALYASPSMHVAFDNFKITKP